MTIHEAEEKTGLSRSHIRFYEKEGILKPHRSEANGYRNYTDEDVERICKTAYLRTLGFTMEQIRQLIGGELSFDEALRSQVQTLQNQAAELSRSAGLCSQMLADGVSDFETMDITPYTGVGGDYWQKNSRLLQRDVTGLPAFCSGKSLWLIITALSALAAVIAFPFLPPQIPIQWSHGTVSSLADRIFIFAFPAACILLRLALRPVLWDWLRRHTHLPYETSGTCSNLLCVLTLAIQLFTIWAAVCA